MIEMMDAVKLYKQRGWIQILSNRLKKSIYLVRNENVIVPNPDIPRYTQDEVLYMDGATADGLVTIHEAKVLFGGSIIKPKKG